MVKYKYAYRANMVWALVFDVVFSIAVIWWVLRTMRLGFGPAASGGLTDWLMVTTAFVVAAGFVASSMAGKNNFGLVLDFDKSTVAFSYQLFTFRFTRFEVSFNQFREARMVSSRGVPDWQELVIQRCDGTELRLSGLNLGWHGPCGRGRGRGGGGAVLGSVESFVESFPLISFDFVVRRPVSIRQCLKLLWIPYVWQEIRCEPFDDFPPGS